MSYDVLSTYYDKLLHDPVVMSNWTKSFMRKVKGNKILDMACGSGNAAMEFNKKGYDVFGFDKSKAMITLAKAKDTTNRISYSVKDMLDFEYYDTFDGIVCYMDSLNYIATLEDLRTIFKRVYQHLNVGGLLAFDYHSIDRLTEFQEEFIEEGRISNADYQWSIISEDNMLLSSFIFWRDGDIQIERHEQYIFEIEFLRKMMEDIGFTVAIKSIGKEKHYVEGRKK